MICWNLDLQGRDCVKDTEPKKLWYPYWGLGMCREGWYWLINQHVGQDLKQDKQDTTRLEKEHVGAYLYEHRKLGDAVECSNYNYWRVKVMSHTKIYLLLVWVRDLEMV